MGTSPMNINRMTDEELTKELERHFDVPAQSLEIAQFIRRCVKDSQKELVEALKVVDRTETEYDGRMYYVCPWCFAQDDKECKKDCLRTNALRKAMEGSDD